MAVLAVDQTDLGAAMKTLIRTLMYPDTERLSPAQRSRVEGMVTQTASAMRSAALTEAELLVGSARLSPGDVRSVLYGLSGTVSVSSGHEVRYLGESLQGHRVSVDGRPATITRVQVDRILSEADDSKLRAAAKKMARGNKEAEERLYQNMLKFVDKAKD